MNDDFSFLKPGTRIHFMDTDGNPAIGVIRFPHHDSVYTIEWEVRWPLVKAKTSKYYASDLRRWLWDGTARLLASPNTVWSKLNG